MSRNSIIPVLAAAVAVGGLATGLALQDRTRLQLREEHHALQQQLDRVTDLLAQNERQATQLAPANANAVQSLASEPSELPRLRAEFAVLRQLTNDLERARNENNEAHSTLDRYLAREDAPKVATADFWPRDSWNFAGLASPDDALRSALWAADNGNLKALFDSTTGELRQLMEKEYDSKSTNEAAIQAMDDVSNLKSVQVVNREFQSDDTVLLTVTLADGDEPHTAKLVLKKVGADWKLAGVGDN